MAKVNVVHTTETATLSPLARVVRTILQTALAFAAAEPTLIGLVHLSAPLASEVAGITAGLVFTVAALQNVLEHFGVMPTTGAKLAPATLPEPTV